MHALGKTRILVVEDDPIQLGVVGDYLTALGYQVLPAGDGEEGLQSALKNLPDLVLADWMLPRRSGIDLCRHLRELGCQIPVVLLTAKSDLESQVGGLNCGADDYWVKPVPLRLMKAKIEALLRRREPAAPGEAVFKLGPATFTPETGLLRSPDKQVELNPKECGILRLLLVKEGVPVGRDRLLAAVWGYGRIPNSRTVDNYVVSLRRKLEAVAGTEIVILTRRGQGYVLRRGGADAA